MSYLTLTLPDGQQIAIPKGVPNPSTVTISKVIGNVVTLMLVFSVVLALIFLIVGGIQWITSGGDKTKASSARSRITYAIIGLVIALGAFFIVNAVGFLFKSNLLNINF